MIKIKWINRGFKQKGNVCVIASYGFVIEYFSKKKIHPNKVIANFVDFFPNLKSQIKKRMSQIKRKHRAFERQQMIYHAFIDYCRSNGDIRGYELIEELHNTNALYTRKYCNIINYKALRDEYINKDERLELREKLKSQGLAIVLYPTDLGSHSILVGFEKLTKIFFYRDPNRRIILYTDFLQNNDIFEYIYFNKSIY